MQVCHSLSTIGCFRMRVLRMESRRDSACTRRYLDFVIRVASKRRDESFASVTTYDAGISTSSFNVRRARALWLHAADPW